MPSARSAQSNDTVIPIRAKRFAYTPARITRAMPSASVMTATAKNAKLVAAHLRIPAHAEGICAERPGAVEGDEVRRKEFGRGLLRDAIPVLLARQGQIARRVHYGYEHRRIRLHSGILIGIRPAHNFLCNAAH